MIFSLTVNSEQPIPAFAAVAGRKRAPRDDDDHFYNFGTVSFDEARSEFRADKLNDIVNAAIDRLEATDVDHDLLAHDDILVRAHFTFAPGAETIDTATIQRLGHIHATVWIDALDG